MSPAIPVESFSGVTMKNNKSTSEIGPRITAPDQEALNPEEARRRRVVHAAALMELFRRANGREAWTAEELRRWAAAREPNEAIDPSAILTPEQIRAALHDCLRRR